MKSPPSKHISETTIHRVFEIALILKALHSVLEILLSIFVGLISTDTVLRWAKWVTQTELLEDPNDLIASYILKVARDFSLGGRSGIVAFLASHGIVKLVLVLSVLKGWPWAYPAFMVALAGLIGFQSFQLLHRLSAGLAVLTIFDVFVLFLTWHEYRLVRAKRQ